MDSAHPGLHLQVGYSSSPCSHIVKDILGRRQTHVTTNKFTGAYYSWQSFCHLVFSDKEPTGYDGHASVQHSLKVLSSTGNSRVWIGYPPAFSPVHCYPHIPGSIQPSAICLYRESCNHRAVKGSGLSSVSIGKIPNQWVLKYRFSNLMIFMSVHTKTFKECMIWFPLLLSPLGCGAQWQGHRG